MNKKYLLLGLILILFAAAAYLVYNRQNYNTSISILEEVKIPVLDQENIKEFEVSGANFMFNPAEIKVKQNDQVKITFKNIEGFHDLVLDDFNVATSQLAANQEEAISFTANKTGTFEYYCSVGNHRQMGMVGKLIVE